MSAAKQKTSPWAGQTMTGADMVLRVLAEEGVDAIFGYSGGAILPVYDAVFRYNEEMEEANRIRLVVPANEQGAGFMAAGYARASGKVGCLLVTSGPGATNCVTPIRDCMADSIPVVMLCGQVPRGSIGTDAFQEAPVYNIMSACAKHVFLVKEPERLEETIRAAFEIARSGRPGPVVIDLPKDVQNWRGIYQGSGILHFKGYEKRLEAVMSGRIPEEKRDSFFTMLSASSRPLIYAGGGVILGDASAELREFSHKLKIPVVTTLMGIGCMDTRDDLCLNMLGMHGAAYANYAVEDCDFLITIGARFDDRVAGKVDAFAPNAKAIAHIDIDAAEIGKVKAASWSYVGDAKTALADLTAHASSVTVDFSAWAAHVKEMKQRHAMNYNHASAKIQPYYVIECLNEITKGEAIIVTGVGQHQMWAAQYFHFKSPRTWITSGCMGTMGFGVPAAVGAKIACPDRIVIDVDGDGSIRMNYGDLETLTTYNVAAKVLLLNNQGDGMVRQWQTLYFGERFSGTDKTLHCKDFVKAAEADGYGFARRVTTMDGLQKALEEFVAFEGPAFLEVMIDRDAHVYPMVGPGMSYKEMLTGPYITGRDVPVQPKETDPTPLAVTPELF